MNIIFFSFVEIMIQIYFLSLATWKLTREQLMSSDQWSLDPLGYGHVSSLGHMSTLQRVQCSLALDRSPSQLTIIYFGWLIIFLTNHLYLVLFQEITRWLYFSCSTCNVDKRQEPVKQANVVNTHWWKPMGR